MYKNILVNVKYGVCIIIGIILLISFSFWLIISTEEKLYGKKIETYFRAFTFGKEKSIGVSMGYPYVHHDLLGNAETFINTYGCSDELIDACVEVILGERDAAGNSPVKIVPDQIWY